MENKTSILSNLLFQKPLVPAKRGRLIRFDSTDPSIELATGPLPERIMGVLKLTGDPMTLKDIANCIASNPSRVVAAIKPLVKAGSVLQIKVDGCTTEYVTNRSGTY